MECRFAFLSDESDIELWEGNQDLTKCIAADCVWGVGGLESSLAFFPTVKVYSAVSASRNSLRLSVFF